MVIFSGSGWDGGVLHQYMAAISGSLCYTIMGAATAWPSPTLIKMANNDAPVVLDVIEISWMVSLLFLGHVTSPLPSGFLMDRLGRKRTCLVLAVFPFLSWLLIFFAQSPVYLYIARLAAGLWIGVTTTIMPIYVGEIAGQTLRSSLSTINNLLLNFGVLFAYVIGPYVSYYMLAVACELLTMVYFCAFLFMPESPHYLIMRGRRPDAVEALKWLRKGEPEENIENEVKRIEQSIAEQKLQKGTLKDIFCDDGNRRAFIISITYAVIKRLSGSGVLQAYASTTLPKVTLGVLDPDTCVIIIGFVSLLSSVASTVIAIRFRRRILLTISCGGCALFTAIVMVWFYLDANTTVAVSGYSDVIFVSFVLYYSVFNIGLGPVGTSIKGEMFSANVKALSSSLTTLVVAFSGFIMNKFYLVLADSVGMYANYLIFSLSCVAAIVFTWTYMPETHNKTVEEVLELLRHGKRHKSYSSTK